MDLKASFPHMSHLSQANSFFNNKKFKSVGTCSGDTIVSLLLPGHFIPATLRNELRSLPGAYLLKFLKFILMIRLLHKLGDADGCLTRQNRFFGHRFGRSGGCPPSPRKTDDYGKDGSNNNPPNP